MLTTTTYSRLQESDLLGFGKTVESNVRSLDLLRAIDVTISSLLTYRDLFDALRQVTGEIHAQLLKPTAAELGMLDPDGKVEDAINKILDLLDEHYNLLADKREYARKDSRLTTEDGVADAYTEVMESVYELHAALSGLLWCVGEHDADVEIAEGKVSRSYKAEEIEELLTDLKK